MIIDGGIILFLSFSSFIDRCIFTLSLRSLSSKRNKKKITMDLDVFFSFSCLFFGFYG